MQEALAGIADRYGLRDIYVFGSRTREVAARVRGRSDARPEEGSEGSDIDLAVQPLRERELTAQERVKLTDDLERLLEAPRVDLVVLSEASSLLAVDVVRGELLYSSDELAQAEHELYVLRRAADLAPHQRERVRTILHEGGR